VTSSFNPLDHPIALKRPRRLVSSPRNEHVPFAMTLVDVLKPRTVVEVGPVEGALPSALREAVLELALEARCDAVRTSEEARAGYPEGSIDLLYLTGSQPPDAVKRDLEAWLPKMSARGVVLLDDTNARDLEAGGFAAGLTARYPFFEFPHANGLRVIAVGREQPAPFRALLEATPEEAAGIRALFARLGRALSLEAEHADSHLRSSGHEAERLRQRLAAREEEIKGVRQYLEAREGELRAAQEALDRIRRSLAWRLLTLYRGYLQSSRLLRFAHLLVAWPLGWIGAARQRSAQARATRGAATPQLLFLPRPEPEQARRELEALRSRFPGHALSVVVPRGQRSAFAGPEPSQVRIYDRPEGSVWAAGLELVRELRERTFDVLALPWQPAFEGARFSMSLILSLLVKVRARVVLGKDLEPRPLRRRTVAATLFELFVFLAGLPFARLATRLPLLLVRRAGEAPAPEPGRRAGALAILIPILPDLSHTFIYREVLKVLAHMRGQRPVVVVALEEGSYRPLHPEARSLLAHAVFVRTPSLAGYLCTYLRYLVTRPLRLARLIRLLSPDGRGDAALFLRLENLHGLHPSRGLALARLLEREGVDHVHCYGMSYPATRAIVAARLLDVPFSISTFVDFDYEYPFKCLSEKVREARFVVTCTRYCKERLLTLTDGTHAGKVHVIHHSLDPGYGSAPSNGDAPMAGTRRVDVFAASRLVPKKGFDYLLEAFARLRDRGLDVRCRLMGDGEEGPRLKQRSSELELTDRVWFAGSVPNDQIWAMAGPHDICVLPSVYCGDGERDGIPVILLEALSRGHAAVSTRVSGIPELIEDGVHGLLVPDRDADALADAIERLVKDDELRERLARAGRDRVRAEFNLEDKGRELLGLIESARGGMRTEPAAEGDLADARPPGSRPSVSVVLVNYNGARYVERLFDSLARQTYPPAEAFVFDNGSTDGSDRMIEERYPWVRVFRLGHNTGYSFPVNEGIRRSSGEYVLVLNVDLVLTDDFVEELVAALDEDPGVGWAAGKVLKLRDSGPSEDIDCLGHHMSRNRYARERDYSRPFAWADYAEKRFVFGASACAALYRRAMLEDIRLGDDYFDEDFFAYFEDVDVDWRAQQRGWKCVYTPRAVAYHVRGGTGLIRQRHIAACYLANRWLMVVKNDDPAHLLQDLRPVVGQLVRDVGRSALEDPLVIPVALRRLARNLPRMVRKRRAIKARRTVPRAYLRDLIR
jgi:GT2 family glycosyltransferase/glycosyltransferase involved in cell wall biosynthesis